MEVIVNKNKLQKALRILRNIVSKNKELPILNTILLKVENGRLRLSATNLEISISYWIDSS